MFRRHARTIAAVVLCVFTWTSGGVFTVAHAAQDALKKGRAQEQQKIPEGTEERFSRLTEELTVLLADPKVDVEQKKQRLVSGRTEMDGLDKEIRKQFAETETRLKDAKLPAEILERHYRFVKHYDDNLAELRANVERVEKAKDKKQAEAEIEKMRSHLEKVKAPSRHQPLDPNNLPHRQPKVIKREPRMLKEEFERDLKKDKQAWRNEKRILLASTSTAGLLAPDDLAETIEVQFTPDIKAKAQELGNNPVKIYEWVRNNIEFVPTWGSIQGAQHTLLTKQGNAFDTASLLIALLRAAGIQARYVTGTIVLPIDKVMNWAGGFTDPMAALDFMTSGGVPTTGLVEGGTITKARLEHVWVEAFIDYIPSRGAKHVNGKGDTWIQLDPSYKQYDYTEGIDIKSAVPFDAQAFLTQIQSTATVNESQGYVTGVDSLITQQTMQDYQGRVQNYIQQNYPNATVGDVLGKKEIATKQYSYLLGTLPYRTAVKGATFSSIPDTLRHRLSFNVINGDFDNTPLSITKSLAELAGKKITLSYAPASVSDTQLLISYLGSGSPSLPAYLIHLKPELRIGGEVVGTGRAIIMGKIQTFQMGMSAPTLDANQITNTVTAGAFSAIVLDYGAISAGQVAESASRVEEVKAQLEAKNLDGMSKDDIMGEFLHATGLGYWSMVDFESKAAASINHVANVRLPSEGIFTYDVATTYFFGIPHWVTPNGFTTDIDADLHVVFGRNGSAVSSVSYMMQIGMLASKLEAGIYDFIFNNGYTGRGVSAAHILEYANATGVPVYTVDANNVNAVLPALQVGPEVKDDVRNAVTSGRTVMIPKTIVTKDGWKGTGYLVFDSSTGGGSYRISGGLSGGGYDCQCWGLSPIEEFIVGALLVGMGVVAGTGVAVALAIAGTIIAAISLASAICQISNSSDLSADDARMMISFVSAFFVASVFLAVLGISAGAAIGYVAIAMLFLVLSIVASNMVANWGPWFARLRQRYP